MHVPAGAGKAIAVYDCLVTIHILERWGNQLYIPPAAVRGNVCAAADAGYPTSHAQHLGQLVTDDRKHTCAAYVQHN